MMIAALGTLPFLATLWLLAVMGATILEESGAKIAAALKGHSPARASVPFHRSRLRLRARSKQVISAPPCLRAAA